MNIGSITQIGASTSSLTRGAASSPAASVSGTSFGEMLEQKAAAAMDTLRNAETQSVAGLNGEADIRQVVDAVMQAERTLQTAVALREKVIASYLDISRMTI